MAEIFKRKADHANTVVPSGNIFYTVPNGVTTVGLSLLSTYVGAAVSSFITVQTSGVAGETYWVKQGEVQAGSSLELIANKMVLSSGDSVIVGVSAPNTIDITFSYLELS